jgi:predicted nucleic acid-binding protein
MKLLIDTNIVLDLLLAREPFLEDARNLAIGVINREFDGFLAASTITDLHYIMLKNLQNEQKTREALANILSIFPLIDTTAEDIQNALTNPMQDFEDAVLAESARREGIKYILTRSEKDFTSSPVPPCSPGLFLQMFDNQAS